MASFWNALFSPAAAETSQALVVYAPPPPPPPPQPHQDELDAVTIEVLPGGQWILVPEYWTYFPARRIASVQVFSAKSWAGEDIRDKKLKHVGVCLTPDEKPAKGVYMYGAESAGCPNRVNCIVTRPMPNDEARALAAKIAEMPGA